MAVDERYRERVRPEDVPGDRRELRDADEAAPARTRTTRDLTQLAEYEAAGGYESLRKALGMERQAVVDELLAAGVRGRGGAGFPMGRKASFLPKPEQTRSRYLVVNADESEPGTFKDRELMLRDPHALIEGILIGLRDPREAGLHLHPRRVPDRVRGRARGARGGAERRLVGKTCSAPGFA